jgi:hypothetical protein
LEPSIHTQACGLLAATQHDYCKILPPPPLPQYNDEAWCAAHPYADLNTTLEAGQVGVTAVLQARDGQSNAAYLIDPTAFNQFTYYTTANQTTSFLNISVTAVDPGAPPEALPAVQMVIVPGVVGQVALQVNGTWTGEYDITIQHVSAPLSALGCPVRA